MGKTLKYGEFTFSKPNTRPTTGSYRSTKGISSSTYDKPHAMKDGGACYAKGGAKKPAQKATSAVKKAMKREPEAIVRKEVALLKKAGAPKAIVEHEMREMTAPMEMKKGGMSKMDKKMGQVMREYGDRELHSGSKDGPVVRNPKQALAIAYSEGRKAVKKADGGMMTEGERAQMAQSTEKDRADSRVLQQLARKYGAQEEAAERRGLMEAARAMGSRGAGAAVTDAERRALQGGAMMTEGERARMMGRKNYATGGSVESKLKKHASMPASQAHGPKAAAKLAKGGVPTFSKVPKVGRMK